MSFLLFVGFALAVWYLASSGYISSFSQNQKTRKFSLEDAKFLVSLLARVAKSDGVVSKSEAEYISGMLDEICEELEDYSVRNDLKATYSKEKNRDTSVFNIAFEYKFKRRLSDQECLSIVIYLLNLAYVDGVFESSEREVIESVCDAFDIDNFTRNNLFARFEDEFETEYDNGEEARIQAKKDPYEVLGLAKTASFDEIKKQYRVLARKYHPDFLGGDADANVVANATKKLQEINEAYAELKAKFEK